MWRIIKTNLDEQFVRIEASVYKDDYNRLERAYRVLDPWNLSSQREQCRFQAVNEFIGRHCGRINTILEIGSGEGHHTQHLQVVADHIVGVEVSSKAIARARSRCPTVRFVQGQFPPLPLPVTAVRAHYDLVIASEVLYYVRDINAVIRAMSHHGKSCLATCYEREIHRLDRYLLSVPGVIHQDIDCEGLRYRIYLWNSAEHS